ncbi:MAG: hypothetical protein AB3N64_13455 [Puniceicoccaceae bacterium]
MNPKSVFPLLASLLLHCSIMSIASAAPEVVIFQLAAKDLAGFERNAATAKELGATHMDISMNLPPATWQMDPPDDPYPAWYVGQIDFLKAFPPPELEKHVDMDHAREVAEILTARCKILRKHGLKAFWKANTPQVLPESFFTDHPHLRGPRVDQPNRARVARFAPCMDKEESLRLYRDSLLRFLEACPEVEIMSFLTTDSGSGFCWVPGLYPGANGPAWCEHRSMADRVAGFLTNLQDGARERGHELQVNIHQISPRQWMRPSFPEPMETVRRLPEGLALNGLEGPDGKKFIKAAGASGWRASFYPIVGIVVPGLNPPSQEQKSSRLLMSFGDFHAQETNLRLYNKTRLAEADSSLLERYTSLHQFAIDEVGEELADEVLEMWRDLNTVLIRLDAMNFGPVLRMGHLLARWINRPMVPFPEELTPEETSYYRPYLFQAKGEEQANNLIDIQAMRMFEGWGAKMLVQRVMERTIPDVQNATLTARKVSAHLQDENKKKEWRILSQRLEALECLLVSADNMIAYQAYLDRAKALAVAPEANPPLGAENSWDRRDIMQIARDEIDNALRLRTILLSSEAPILDMAAEEEDESIMLLSPALADQLKLKIDIMNAHWRDYDRLYTVPNP